MWKIDLSGIIPFFLICGILIGLACWGGYELVDWLFIDDAIKVTEPIKPEIEIIIKDNVIDTLYVYRKP